MHAHEPAQPSEDEGGAGWARLGSAAKKPVITFRLPGIYGPGRNALAALRKGTARRVIKPGQVFNRVHVEDIATALALSLAKDAACALYNVTDDEPSPPQNVIAFAAELLGVEPPPEIAFEDAELSPMAASFYGENKRVSNALIKRALGFAPAFPSYREGLRELLRQGEGAERGKSGARPIADILGYISRNSCSNSAFRAFSLMPNLITGHWHGC